jgi:hypothetical protein
LAFNNSWWSKLAVEASLLLSTGWMPMQALHSTISTP